MWISFAFLIYRRETFWIVPLLAFFHMTLPTLNHSFQRFSWFNSKLFQFLSQLHTTFNIMKQLLAIFSEYYHRNRRRLNVVQAFKLILPSAQFGGAQEQIEHLNIRSVWCAWVLFHLRRFEYSNVRSLSSALKCFGASKSRTRAI